MSDEPQDVYQVLYSPGLWPLLQEILGDLYTPGNEKALISTDGDVVALITITDVVSVALGAGTGDGTVDSCKVRDVVDTIAEIAGRLGFGRFTVYRTTLADDSSNNFSDAVPHLTAIPTAKTGLRLYAGRAFPPRGGDDCLYQTDISELVDIVKRNLDGLWTEEDEVSVAGVVDIFPASCVSIILAVGDPDVWDERIDNMVRALQGHTVVTVARVLDGEIVTIVPNAVELSASESCPRKNIRRIIVDTDATTPEVIAALRAGIARLAGYAFAEHFQHANSVDATITCISPRSLRRSRRRSHAEMSTWSVEHRWHAVLVPSSRDAAFGYHMSASAQVSLMASAREDYYARPPHPFTKFKDIVRFGALACTIHSAAIRISNI